MGASQIAAMEAVFNTKDEPKTFQKMLVWCYCLAHKVLQGDNQKMRGNGRLVFAIQHLQSAYKNAGNKAENPGYKGEVGGAKKCSSGCKFALERGQACSPVAGPKNIGLNGALDLNRE